jgi:hypothetical protein
MAVEKPVETASGGMGTAVQTKRPRGVAVAIAGGSGGKAGRGPKQGGQQAGDLTPSPPRVVICRGYGSARLLDALVHIDAVRRPRRGRRWLGLVEHPQDGPARPASPAAAGLARRIAQISTARGP